MSLTLPLTHAVCIQPLVKQLCLTVLQCLCNDTAAPLTTPVLANTFLIAV